MAVCYRHPNRETAVSCSSCGRSICPDCMTPTPVGMRCPECSRQRTRVANLRSSGTSQPTVTYVLIAVNTLIEFASAAGGSSIGGTGTGGSLIDNGALSRAAVAHGDLWRLLTSGFLHENFLHLLFNMYALYVLGSLLEPVVGRLRFTLIYFVSLFAGSLGALIAQPLGYTVGASGAVFGLMGAALIVLRGRGVGGLQGMLIFWIAFNLIYSFAVPGISIGGHIGGLIGGALAAIVLVELPRRLRVPASASAVVAAAIGVAAIAASVAVAGTG